MKNVLFKESDLIGSEVCFLLTIDYIGAVYRFSTYPIDIEDKIENEILRYEGGLSDPSFVQTTKFVGVQLVQDSISLELIFNDVDWIEEWINGRSLDHSKCTLSMVTVRNSKADQDEMNKIHLFSGRVVDPIFGVPNREKGYIVFSIQNDIQVSKVKLLENSFEIDVYKFPNLEGLL